MSTTPRLIGLSKNKLIHFWQIGDQIYRAPEAVPISSKDHLLGKRWECPVSHWLRFRNVFDWVDDVDGGAIRVG